MTSYKTSHENTRISLEFAKILELTKYITIDVKLKFMSSITNQF